jgi:hypothetical protein
MLSESEFAIHMGLKSNPILGSQSSWRQLHVNQKYRGACFRPKSVRKCLGDEFIWYTIRKCRESDDTIRPKRRQ